MLNGARIERILIMVLKMGFPASDVFEISSYFGINCVKYGMNGEIIAI